MRDIIIVSSWRRAKYLQICFDALLRARGIDDKLVLVCQNDRSDADVALVHEVLSEAKHRFRHFRVEHQFFKDTDTVWGWAFNQCAGFQIAYDCGADKIYFLSDDDIVTPDFFEWHEAVQNDDQWFGSTAWRHPEGDTKPYDLEAYYQISFPNEISHGLCVKRDSIPIMLKSYPDWCPQERMIREGWRIVMPYVPRVYHIGKYSSQLASVGANTGPSVDELPVPIPDYGQQKVRLVN